MSARLENQYGAIDSIPEWDCYLLYYARTKEENKTEVPMSFEEWREWKRQLASSDENGRER